uniref:Uncharacterized protein n=1 Tax=viral metagenome TaxID=1070528 RepID=A0A6M3XZQ3_9ZZZZ
MGWADKDKLNVWDRLGMGLYAAGGGDPIEARTKYAELQLKKQQLEQEAPYNRQIKQGQIADALQKQVDVGAITSEQAMAEFSKYFPAGGVSPSPEIISPNLTNSSAPPAGVIPGVGSPFISPLQKEEEKGKITAKNKWNTEDAERNIKFDIMTPKLQNYMELGGRAYTELRNVAKQYGLNLNFETGGLNAIMTIATKNIAMKTKLAPLMTALQRLRPELGTELMRQLGAFRSAQMAEKFEKTLAEFSGDIREDIANMSTTLVKNKANTVLLDDKGKPLPDEERNRRMDGFEANLIRKYNFMYRGMGLTTKPYTAERSFEWLAKNSTFNDAENGIIKNAMDDNPKFSKEKIIAKLIEKGLL